MSTKRKRIINDPHTRSIIPRNNYNSFTNNIYSRNENESKINDLTKTNIRQKEIIDLTSPEKDDTSNQLLPLPYVEPNQLLPLPYVEPNQLLPLSHSPPLSLSLSLPYVKPIRRVTKFGKLNTLSPLVSNTTVQFHPITEINDDIVNDDTLSIIENPTNLNVDDSDDLGDSPYLPITYDRHKGIITRDRIYSRIPLKFLKRQLSNNNTSPIIERIQTGLSPEIKQFQETGNEVPNEKFSSYTFLQVHLCFTSKLYKHKYSYENVLTIDINVDVLSTEIERQIKEALITLTSINEKRHILIFSTTLLQTDLCHFSEEKRLIFINADKSIAQIYNRCLQSYSETNIMHSNISIYHCVVGYDSIHKSPRLHQVRTKQSDVNVFNKIRNFSSLRLDDNVSSIDKLYIDRVLNVTFRMISYINDGDYWWHKYYSELSVHMKGYLRQRSATCWLNCIINLILLSPLSDEVKENREVQNAKLMTFTQLSEISCEYPLNKLLFSLFKILILRNTSPNGKIDVIYPIAARFNALIYRGNPRDFNSLTYGNGCGRTALVTLEVFKMLMESKFISYIDIEKMGTIVKALASMQNMTIIAPKKYILFCGIFHNASKVIFFQNQEYYLLGAIIRVSYKNCSRHAICGNIINGKECTTDSNGYIKECIWSTSDATLFQPHYPKYDVVKVRLLNCVYIRKNT